jgi:hypothetical protein
VVTLWGIPFLHSTLSLDLNNVILLVDSHACG